MTTKPMASFANIVTVCALLILVAPVYALASTPHLVVEHELGVTHVPAVPERVVVFDFGVLDTLDKLGVDVVALPKATMPAYLAHYQDARYVNAGSLKEPDFERIHALNPDIILISGRQADLYDEFQAIAPTIHIALDPTRYVESFEENVLLLGVLFDKEDDVADALAEVNLAIETLRSKIKQNPKSALVVLVNDQAISAYGPGSRFGFIHDDFGFTPVSTRITASTHGQTISSEFILAMDPDYLFVIDRTAAVDGRSSAKQVIENPLVRFTKAYEEGNIVYLSPDSWYLSGGGLISMADMVREIAEAVD